MEIVSAQQMRQLESLSEKAGLTSQILINNAGKQIGENLLCQIGQSKKTLLFLIGPGNNGYDGLLAAQYLRNMKLSAIQIYTYACTDPKLLSYNITVSKESPFSDSIFTDPKLSSLKKLIQVSDIVVDSILGIGISRPIQNTIKKNTYRVKQRKTCSRFFKNYCS